MRNKRKKRTRLLNTLLVFLATALVVLVGAGTYVLAFAAGFEADGPSPVVPAGGTQAGHVVRDVPPLSLPATPAGAGTNTHMFQDGTDIVVIDTSTAAQGYIMARCETERQARIIIRKDNVEQLEYLPTDGKYYAFPLAHDDGIYHIKASLQHEGTLYYRVLELNVEVAIEDDFTRFLLPIPMAQYSEESSFIVAAQQMYQEQPTNGQFVAEVFRWVTSAARYDKSLLEVEDGRMYVPDLERIVQEGTAICSDYASLFAAMLRSCGVPCQIIYGNMETAEGSRYHAWNLVWLEDEGEGKWWLYDPTSGIGAIDPDATEMSIQLNGKPVYGPPLEIR